MTRIIFLLIFLTSTLIGHSQRFILMGGKTNLVLSAVNVTFPTVGGNFAQSPAGRWGPGVGQGLSASTMGANGTYEAELATVANQGVDIGLDAANTLTDYFQYDYALFVIATGAPTANYYYVRNGSFFDSGVASAYGDRYRLRREGGIVYAEYYRGGTWNNIHTYTGTSTGTLYLKADITFETKYLLNPKATGVL